jgi:LysM repeat protein
MSIAVVIPGQFGETYAGSQIYARRRLMALLSLAAIVLVLFVGAGHVVANRGGAPASASMIRPATSAAALPPAVAHLYVAQAGDTLWSIGQRFHGHVALADYVDALVEANGGTKIQVSQAIALP